MEPEMEQHRRRAVTVLREALESNDKEELGHGVLESGQFLFEQKRFGKAVAKFELAAEIFRELGNKTLEIQALDNLAQSYRALDYEKRATEVETRRKVILDTMSSTSPETSLEKPNSFSLLGMFGSSTEKDLRNVDKAKRTISSMVPPETDQNEGFMQRHMMQVHFEDLLFEDVSKRMEKDALRSIDEFEDHVRRFYMSVKESVYVGSMETKGLGESETAGSLQTALREWEATNIHWGQSAESCSNELKEEVLLPIARLRGAIKTICDVQLEELERLSRKEQDARKSLENEQFSLKKAKQKVFELEDRALQVRQGSPSGKEIGKTLSESMGDILGKKMTLEERALDNVRKAKRELELAQRSCHAKAERLEAAIGARQAAWKRSCREFESIEQFRIAIFGDMLHRLARIQQKMLSEWQAASQRLLTKVKNLDPASDVRAFCNQSLIQAVLSGKSSPSSLFCSPLATFRHEYNTLLHEQDSVKGENADHLLVTVTDDEEEDTAVILRKELPVGLGYVGASGASESQDKDANKARGARDANNSREEQQQDEQDEDKVKKTDSGETQTDDDEVQVLLPKVKELEKKIDMFVARLESRTGRQVQEVQDQGEKDDKQGEKNEEDKAEEKLVREICEGFHFRSVREKFLRSLNRFRSTRTCISSTDMNNLVLLMIAFLDSVYIQGDIRAAKMALILAETFYTEQDGTEEDGKKVQRFYIQDGIKEHGIWKTTHFWEETFFLAVREEIHRNVVRGLHDGGLNRRRSLAIGSHENITFGQIGSSAFNMLSVGLPRHHVEQFVERMSTATGIDASTSQGLFESLFEKPLHSGAEEAEREQ